MAWAYTKDVLKHFKMITEFEAFVRRVGLALGIAVVVVLLSVISSSLAYVLQAICLILFFYCAFNALFPVADSNDSLISLVAKPQKMADATVETQSKVAPEAVEPVDLPVEEDALARKARFRKELDKTKKENEKKIDTNQRVFLPASLGDGTAYSIILTSPALSAMLKLIMACLFMPLFYSLLFNRFWIQRSGILFFLVVCVVYLLTEDLLKTIDNMDISDFPTRPLEKASYRFWRLFASSKGYHFLGMLGRHRIGLPRWMRFLHLLIAGPTGAQKSTSEITPQLLHDATAPGSAVVPDSKSPELFTNVAGRWIKYGKKAFLFDPWHPDSVAFNPLLGADDKDLLTITNALLQEREEIMSEEEFFKSRSRYLLYAILRMVQTWGEKYCHLATVYHLVQSVDTLHEFITVLPAPLALLFSDYNTKLSKESKAHALTSIRGKLDIFMDPAVRKAFARSDFTLSMLFRQEEPCLLVLGAPIDHKEAAIKINSLIVNLIVNMAFRETRMQKQAKQKGEKGQQPNSLYLYLDELRSLKVAALPDLVSIARDSKISIICSVTDLDFFKIYGNDRASLMSNLRTQLYFHKLDLASADYVSKQLGKEKTQTYGLMRGSSTVRPDKEVMLEPAEVQNIAADEVIMFNPVTEPSIATLSSINNTKWLQRMKVECPKSMKEYYSKWGLCVEEIEDPQLPRLDSITYDFTALQKGRPMEEVKLVKAKETLKEKGGGKITIGMSKHPQEEDNASQKKWEDTEGDGGAYFD